MIQGERDGGKVDKEKGGDEKWGGVWGAGVRRMEREGRLGSIQLTPASFCSSCRCSSVSWSSGHLTGPLLLHCHSEELESLFPQLRDAGCG